MELSELISSYYEAVHHASKENEWTLYCPFCQGNGHVGPSRLTLGINTVKEIGHCHRCDWRASGRNLFYQLADEVNSNDEYTPGEYYEVEQKKKPTKFSLKKVKLPKEFEPLWKDVNDKLGRHAKEYLTSRRITEEQIYKHRLGFCGAGKYSYRIILPIFYKEVCVGYTARTFADKEPKYLISDGEKFLYGYPTKRKRRCILIEGPFDKLIVEQFIHDYDCIGRQGSALTDLQLYALSKYEEIVIWPDFDEPGIKGAVKVAKIISRETNCKLFGVKPPKDFSGLDPGELSKKQVSKCISNIRPWTPTLVKQLFVSVLF